MKNYTKPDMATIKFDTENILTGSSPVGYAGGKIKFSELAENKQVTLNKDILAPVYE